ncbi:MAG: DUF2167 domain-containing protein [Methylophagaceae bacterium]
MKFKIILSVLFLFLSASLFAEPETEITAEEKEYYAWAEGIWNSLDRQTGTIQISGAGATLNVPENYYYLNAEDAEKVLVEVWGNPPSEYTLGMLFPTEMTPFDEDSWAVTVEYEEDGYVSDENADEIDYADLLGQLKDETEESNQWRVEQGYEPIELVGWAATPYYDAQAHKLHWAKEIKFGEQDVNTLNYNIRVLGRKGVLVLNFIAGIDQKEIIDKELDTVLAMAEFDQGSTYSEFDPDIDKIAAYGIGALVAGKVLAKTGFLVAAIIFLKKFGIIFIIAIGAFLKKVFSRKKDNDVG